MMVEEIRSILRLFMEWGIRLKNNDMKKIVKSTFWSFIVQCMISLTIMGIIMIILAESRAIFDFQWLYNIFPHLYDLLDNIYELVFERAYFIFIIFGTTLIIVLSLLYKLLNKIFSYVFAVSYPMEEFIKNAIRQNVCKSSAKNCISKHWDKVLTLSESGDPQRELVHFSSFEISCVQLIVSAINNQIFKSQLLEMLDNSWDKIYRMEKLPVESEEEKEFKEKVRKYVNNPTSGLFWFINALDYSTAQTPQFVTGKTSSLHLYYHIGMKLQVKTVPKGMYWQITEEKYEPVIFVHTSLAEEILWAMKFVYSSNDGKNISPEKIVSKAMKRLDKIYNRWDENIKDDIRKLIKLLRLYVHEIKASEECQKAMDSMVNEESKYLDKAIIRLIWEVEHN